MAAVDGAEVGEDEVASGAAERERAEEFLYRVFGGACGEEEGHHGEGRRQDDGNSNGAEAPLFEGLIDQLQFSARDAALETLLAAFAAEAISEKAAENGSGGGHEGVVRPEIALVGGQDDGERVHAASQRNDGIVEEREKDEAWAAEMAKELPEAVGEGG